MDVETKSLNLKTADGTMPVHVARPQGAGGKLPAVIVIQEAFGVNDNIQEITGRIAAEGYHAVAPNLYYREGGRAVGYDQLQDAIGLMMRLQDGQVISDLRSLISHLKADPGVRADRIGITGFCMGGRVSYLAACEIPEIRASVPFYGGGISGPQMTPGSTAPAELTAKMKAAILLHYGEKDAYIPPQAIEGARQALQKEEKDFEIHVYPGAGHGFFCKERADYNAEAAKLAWERTKAFFRKHLQQ